MEKRITGHTELIGLIATPIRHSISPEMHNSAFRALGLDYAYLAFEVDKEDLQNVITGLKALKVRGFNVSMPYKQGIIPYLDHLSKEAKLIGAINTVVNDHGILTGYNTDGTGLMEALRNNHQDPKDKKIIIVGCGGAATAITIQAAIDGAKEIIIYNKKDQYYQNALETAKKVKENTDCQIQVKHLDDLVSLKEDMHHSDIFINATSMGMKPHDNMSYIPSSDYFKEDLFVVDIIYNPKETRLLQLAKEANCQTINGIPMLIYQGATAFKLWTGQDMPVDIVRKELQL